jgi:hypothetical protein
MSLVGCAVGWPAIIFELVEQRQLASGLARSGKLPNRQTVGRTRIHPAVRYWIALRTWGTSAVLY